MKNVLRCLIYGDQVSLTLADTTELVNEGIKLHNLAPSSAVALGKALSVTTFMSSCLKEETGQISISLRSDGEGGDIGVSGDHFLRIRGYIANPNLALERNAEPALGDGTLTVVRDDGYSRPFVGACALKGGGTVDASVEEYYRISEQLPTYLSTVVKIAKNGDCSFAGIAVLQPLPFAEDETLAAMPTGEALKAIVEEIASLGLNETLQKHFSDATGVEYKEAQYKCHCSREYLSRVLVTLGEEQMRKIVQEDGCVKAHCHYCNTDYVFTDEDVDVIFKK